MILGAIADDLTGATDLALMLSRGGMRTVQLNGLPSGSINIANADAVIVALKSRTIPAEEAVRLSVEAAKWLLEQGADRLFFKYCSTFDSTDRGNIGQVIDALMDLLELDSTIACPAFPKNGRTVYQGHLFVEQQLLSDSPMKDHPLTPMRDSNLVRVLQAQSRRKVQLLPHKIVATGASDIRSMLVSAKDGAVFIADAISDDDLINLGSALGDSRLVTGGSGIALGLPDVYRKLGLLSRLVPGDEFSAPQGKAVILAGSCSAATRRQVLAAINAGMPTFKLDPIAIDEGQITPQEVAAWVQAQNVAVTVVYSSSDPAEVEVAQQKLGVARVGHVVERMLGAIAQILREGEYRRFIVAGGETSGAVIKALQIDAVSIGPEIDPGVPWTCSIDDERPVVLALKSGNFGSDDFFVKAWELLR